jgi:hypothetical protein
MPLNCAPAGQNRTSCLLSQAVAGMLLTCEGLALLLAALRRQHCLTSQAYIVQQRVGQRGTIYVQ